MILKNILKTKTVSVWGLGYLGYTTMLKLQNSGFRIAVFTTDANQVRQFLSGKYPDREQISSWSRMGYLPKLDYERISLAKNSKELFKSSHLHIITIPESHKNIRDNNITSQLADMFSKNLKDKGIAPLIIFESAFVPGHIEKYFVEKLKKRNLICSRDYYLGTLFRTDWNIEAFIGKNDRMPIAGSCAKSQKAIADLADYLGIPTVKLDNLKESEIYANSINAIQTMVNDFIRQLSLGYPSVNMKKLSEILFKNIMFEDCVLNIGTGGARMAFAVDNLIKGSTNPGNLTLLKEFQDINVTSVLNYGEYITRHGYKSAAILGITYKGNQKDITFSPAITLADYLIKNSVKVFLNDSFCTKIEIERLAKGAEIIGFPDKAFSADVLVLASDQNEYKRLSQSMLDRVPMKTRLIIDNYGIWSHLKFKNRIKYHQVGDGSLNLLK